MIAIWGPSKKNAFLWTSIIALSGALIEIGQWANILAGTFDPFDIGMALTGTALPFLLFKHFIKKERGLE